MEFTNWTVHMRSTWIRLSSFSLHTILKFLTTLKVIQVICLCASCISTLKIKIRYLCFQVPSYLCNQVPFIWYKKLYQNPCKKFFWNKNFRLWALSLFLSISCLFSLICHKHAAGNVWSSLSVSTVKVLFTSLKLFVPGVL